MDKEKETTHRDNNARHERRDNVARARREIEAALILEDAPPREDKGRFDEYVLKWIEKNTKVFRRTFDDLYGEMVDIVAEWRSRPSALLSEIRRRLAKPTKG